MQQPTSGVALDEDAVLAEARERTNLADLGDEGFREPLRRLLASLDREARLHEAGRAAQRGRIVDSLATRLRLQELITRHPEILAERIASPLVVIGLPRTGTTLLQRLLASDPDANAVLWWECRSPTPWPGSAWREGDDPRIADAHAQVRAILTARPELAAIHPWDPEGPDEEVLLLEHSFLSQVPESGANLPSYRAWLTDQDLTPAYDLLVRLLQALQWQKRQSGRLARHWVLKAPCHLAYLDQLFRVFPDARVVQTHRDPVRSLPSIASMYAALWRLASDAVDEHEIGRQCLERYAWALSRCLEARQRLPRERFLDVAYADVLSDPLAQVRRIQAFAGRPLTAAAETAMRRFLQEHAREKRPPHAYTLERFGYTAEAVAAAFADYRARFAASREAWAGGTSALPSATRARPRARVSRSRWHCARATCWRRPSAAGSPAPWRCWRTRATCSRMPPPWAWPSSRPGWRRAPRISAGPTGAPGPRSWPPWSRASRWWWSRCWWCARRSSASRSPRPWRGPPCWRSPPAACW
jgi:hypothetical protein